MRLLSLALSLVVTGGCSFLFSDNANDAGVVDAAGSDSGTDAAGDADVEDVCPTNALATFRMNSSALDACGTLGSLEEPDGEAVSFGLGRDAASQQALEIVSTRAQSSMALGDGALLGDSIRVEAWFRPGAIAVSPMQHYVLALDDPDSTSFQVVLRVRYEATRLVLTVGESSCSSPNQDLALLHNFEEQVWYRVEAMVSETNAEVTLFNEAELIRSETMSIAGRCVDPPVNPSLYLGARANQADARPMLLDDVVIEVQP